MVQYPGEGYHKHTHKHTHTHPHTHTHTHKPTPGNRQNLLWIRANKSTNRTWKSLLNQQFPTCTEIKQPESPCSLPMNEIKASDSRRCACVWTLRSTCFISTLLINCEHNQDLTIDPFTCSHCGLSWRQNERWSQSLSRVAETNKPG